MSLFGRGLTEQEMIAEARRRRSSPVSGRFTFALPAGSDPVDVARHLDGSAARARSAYLTGNYDPATQMVVDVVQSIADAVTDDHPSVDVLLDQDGARRVRGVLAASCDRAALNADFGIRTAVERILDAWDAFSKHDPQQEAHDQARPPRVAAAGGGWPEA